MSQPLTSLPTEELERRATFHAAQRDSQRAGSRGRRHARRALERITAELERRQAEDAGEPRGRGLVPPEAVRIVTSPAGAAYRGKAGCTDLMCTRDGSDERCYGWHCATCHGRSNAQADCRRCSAARGTQS